jgi:hypothetical protein
MYSGYSKLQVLECNETDVHHTHNYVDMVELRLMLCDLHTFVFKNMVCSSALNCTARV